MVRSIVLACLLWAAAAAHAAQLALPLSPEQLAALGVRDAAPQADASATLNAVAQVVAPPAAQAVVAAPVQGVLTSVLASVGDRVRAHQPLARFASAELIEMQRSLGEARSQSALADATLARDEALLREGIIPMARVESARARAREARLAAQSRQAALATAGVAVAADGKPGSVLASPIDGVVVEAPTALGVRSDANAVLFRIAQTDRLQLDATASFAAPAIAPGTKVVVPGRDALGSVIGVAPAPGGTGAQRLRVALERPGSLAYGEWVPIELRPATGRTLRIPARAVFLWNGRDHVFVRTAGGVAAVPVDTGATQGEWANVRAGLEPGQRVVVSGIAALKGLLMGAP